MVKQESASSRAARTAAAKKEKTPAQLAGQEKARLSRQRKTAENKCDSERGGLDIVNGSLDDDFITGYLRDKPGLKSYVCSLLRNGLLERAMAGQKVNNVAGSLGKSVFRLPQGKWRQLGVQVAQKILARLLGDEVLTWFCGDDGLDKSVTTKATFFAIGVSASTSVPQGFDYAHYEAPVLALSWTSAEEGGRN